MQRWDETFHRLSQWTNSSTQAERLAAQILLIDGYDRLDPTHPLGGPDGTQDALIQRDGEGWIMAVYFPFHKQPFGAITKKFKSDCFGVEKSGAIGMVFVTNQIITKRKREKLSNGVNCKVDIYHLERITAILDQPKMQNVRFQFLGIEGNSKIALDSTPDDDQQISTITPTEYAFLRVSESIKPYQKFLAPMLRDRGLTNDASLGVLMCGSPRGYDGPNRQVEWTVFVDAEWLRWYLAGIEHHYQPALKVPVTQIFGQVPGWPDGFVEFLHALVETNTEVIWHRHKDGYLQLSQKPSP